MKKGQETQETNDFFELALSAGSSLNVDIGSVRSKAPYFAILKEHLKIALDAFSQQPANLITISLALKQLKDHVASRSSWGLFRRETKKIKAAVIPFIKATNQWLINENASVLIEFAQAGLLTGELAEALKQNSNQPALIHTLEILKTDKVLTETYALSVATHEEQELLFRCVHIFHSIGELTGNKLEAILKIRPYLLEYLAEILETLYKTELLTNSFSSSTFEFLTKHSLLDGIAKDIQLLNAANLLTGPCAQSNFDTMVLKQHLRVETQNEWHCRDRGFSVSVSSSSSYEKGSALVRILQSAGLLTQDNINVLQDCNLIADAGDVFVLFQGTLRNLQIAQDNFNKIVTLYSILIDFDWKSLESNTFGQDKLDEMIDLCKKYQANPEAAREALFNYINHNTRPLVILYEWAPKSFKPPGLALKQIGFYAHNLQGSRYLVIDFSHPWPKSTRQRARCLAATVLRPARCPERASVSFPQ